MRTRRWVIIGVGSAVATGLATTAVVFGLRGVEVASWLAGVASLVVAIAAAVSAPSSSAPSPPKTTPGATGDRSVTTGEISGIVSTGDNARNVQRR
ncbi:hypothetical protein [Micromonospora sp. RP3T]|uniref:hypothetical protein n=1 Tax=Micromonospora sp. RP3T TaxID=2135446 RepID=UPI000D1753C5|nr:hypothetical protein [Micromonospora sp. RP3T]PTA47443.1 hypothetical protein C8054_05660 [Micromonospora sp. RP3T]